MASSRFPGKPLFEIEGIPLVVRSARRAILAGCFARVVVASEDESVVSVARSHGLEALLTPDFPTGTDRVAWSAKALGARWVVNLQGDEPVFPLELLREMARRIPTHSETLWTAADLGLDASSREDPDVVKILLETGSSGDRTALARDFHRRLVEPTSASLLEAVHVGLYAGSTSILSRFASLPVSFRERERAIEPLRALDAGIPVRAVLGKWNRVAVDRMEHISSVLDHLHSTGERDADR